MLAFVSWFAWFVEVALVLYVFVGGGYGWLWLLWVCGFAQVVVEG